MEIRFQYFDGCPNWHTTYDRLTEAIADRDDVTVTMQRVETAEEATEVEFRGSPSVLIEGTDPFMDQAAPPAGALACRVYQSEDGSPTVDELRDALARHG